MAGLQREVKTTASSSTALSGSDAGAVVVAAVPMPTRCASIATRDFTPSPALGAAIAEVSRDRLVTNDEWANTLAPLVQTLNGVRSLVDEDPKRARDAITRLSRILRYTLRSGEQDTVTLADEMAIVDDFLDLEGLRLAHRLQVTRAIEPRATTTRIPTMLLLTLVENAVKHGIAPLPDGGELAIEIQLVEHDVRIRVRNPRPETLSANAAGEGIGLANLLSTASS